MSRTILAILFLFASTAHAVDMAAIRAEAEGGNTAAMTTIAAMLYHGHGVQRDEAQALQWYLLAASNGHAGAQTIAGVMLLQNGDTASGKYWLRRAAIPICSGGGPVGSGDGARVDLLSVQAINWLFRWGGQNRASGVPVVSASWSSVVEFGRTPPPKENFLASI